MLITNTRTTPTTTTITVDAPGDDAAPVRVRLSSGLLAARLVHRTRREAEVALVAGGAMLLGGDDVRVGIRVAAGCRLTLIDVGGTVAYDGEGRTAHWAAELVVDEGARVAWHAHPFVVCDGADVRRSLHARLGHNARLLLRETLVLGRSGERGGRAVARTDVVDPDGPLLVEELTVDGARPVPGVLGGHRVLDSVLELGAHGDDADNGDGGVSTGEPGDADGDDSGTGHPDGAVTLALERGGRVHRWLGGDYHASPFGVPRSAAR